MKKPLKDIVKEAFKTIDKYEEMTITVKDLKRDAKIDELIVRSNGIYYRSDTLHLVENWKEELGI